MKLFKSGYHQDASGTLVQNFEEMLSIQNSAKANNDNSLGSLFNESGLLNNEAYAN